MSNLFNIRNDYIFWLLLIWIAWTGYEVGKEAKTNWFNKNSQQQESSLNITHREIDSQSDK